MERHEGVSCDACLKANFRSKRWKCLVCSDYDLCSDCYDSRATTLSHNAEHPMQCILTRADMEVYYSGEAAQNYSQHSFACPYCGTLGLTESGLLSHANTRHSNAGHRIVCPICASMPYGYPGFLSENLSDHLISEHRNQNSADLLSILEETSSARNTSRSAPAPATRNIRSSFNVATGSFSSLASSRDQDPIAELLSHLSGARRSQMPIPSRFRDLDFQFQQEQARTSGHQVMRVARRNQQGATTPAPPQPEASININSGAMNNSRFLLANMTENGMQKSDDVELEESRALFVQDVILGCLRKPFDNLENILPSLSLSQVVSTKDASG